MLKFEQGQKNFVKANNLQHHETDMSVFVSGALQATQPGQASLSVPVAEPQMRSSFEGGGKLWCMFPMKT